MHSPRAWTTAEDLYWKVGKYAEFQIQADPVAEPVGAMILAAQENLYKQIQSRDEGRLAALGARAALDRRLHQLYGAVREFALVILGKSGNNRKSAVYRSYFPEGYGRMARMEAEAMVAEVGTLLTHLATETTPDVAEAGSALAPALEAARQAHGAFLEASRELGHRERLLEKAVEDWHLQYARAQKAAELQFLGEPGRAETYFLRFKRPKRSSEPDGGGADGVNGDANGSDDVSSGDNGSPAGSDDASGSEVLAGASSGIAP